MNSTTARWLAPLIFLAVMFGGVGIAQATGFWVTSGRQAVAPGQQLSPDDLKGWMSLQEASDGLRMPVADLVALIAPPEGVTLAPTTAFKDIEALVPGFELSLLRDALRARLGTSTTAPGTPAAPAPTASHVPSPTGTGAASGITGSMTLRQVAEANGLDPAALVAEAGLPADTDLDTTLRALRDSVPGFEIQSVRDAVAALK